MDITVAISGGTDSLFALLALHEQGHRVTALHARFLPAPEGGPSASASPSAPESPIPAMQKLCAELGVPLVIADLTQEFSTAVMRPVAEAHALARTPNPCAMCNRAMKFGRLLDIALEHGERFSTGHYAALADHPAYGPTLRAGADGTKDQSYFLALVPIDRLRLCLFPLAEWKKADIRAWLAARGYEPPIPAESQEICFIPGDDHYAWLEARRAEGLALPGPGPVILAGAEPLPEKKSAQKKKAQSGKAPETPALPPCPVSGRVIAEHRGLWQYTEGQRRGLRIPWSEPVYVLGRHLPSNTLIVGPRHLLPVEGCSASELNIMVPVLLWPAQLFVRVRYHQEPVPADVTVDEAANRMVIRFHSPQQPPAPGQIAAVYDAQGFVLAGGVLD
ncbi:MAG: tRNA-specific 2-thiouridylase [Mailhella sp.]|nr:tRNA-specific 2-thiouridylase [Mailhella sp.]